jgi:serine protease Do
LAVLLLFAASPVPAKGTDNSIAALREMGKAFADIAQKASPAVVSIKSKQVVKQEYQVSPDWPFGGPFEPFGDDLFEQFFHRRMPQQRPQQYQQRKLYRPVQGSGFIISPEGYILTNNHVIEDSEEVMVTLVDKREFTAKVIGTDPDSEVAVIKIDAEKLACLEMADSDKLDVGEWVLAIGNPFGLSHTVTAGIVSAKGRSGVGLTAYEDFIQTDAAINPGNSGGPLIDLDGQVVGINTAIVGPGGNIGIGFAIPINMAKSVYTQLVDTGTVERGFLGIDMEELTPELAHAFGLKDTNGVAVREVIEGSAAAKAGIKHNDIIVEFQGQPVQSANELRNRVAMIKPGTDVEIVVLRDGKRNSFSVKLGERSKAIVSESGRSELQGKLGLTVQNLTDDIAQRLGYEGMTGVVVTNVEQGSLADLAGITEGTLIREVNREPVKNTKDFEKALQETKDEAVMLYVYNGRYSQYMILKLPKD